MTMIMVTHEPDIAAWARKRIYLKDGLIVREERT
jgi:ABC-type lipoprotein export system ATPase subunit